MPLKLLQRTITLEPRDRPHWYSRRNVPMGHATFGRYDVVVDPALGLCEDVATGNTVHTEARGFALIAAYRELREDLASKHERPGRAFNFALGGDRWPRSSRWMSGLLEGDRHLSLSGPKGLVLMAFRRCSSGPRRCPSSVAGYFLIFGFDAPVGIKRLKCKTSL